uniref:LITAF domain-containing protein n=1 Tax=Oreochromis aureus TaxID=47969 RepID=A0AAZ1XTZ5_OREAU
MSLPYLFASFSAGCILLQLAADMIHYRYTTTLHQVIATVGPLGDSPVQIACPNCHQIVLSKVDYAAGLLTYLFCGGLFFCGFVLGCCLIPFCVDRLKDAKHTCPVCKTVLGVYKRL